VEDQASDRAHRMGQLRPVTIYRLVARHTIEESIVELHQHKRVLADSRRDGSDWGAGLSAGERLNLLQEGLRSH
jgi:SNF2 family DNA or RNA helicase